MNNVIYKQLKAIKKIAAMALKTIDPNTATGANDIEHCRVLIEEIDLKLSEHEADQLVYIETLEHVEEFEQFDLREIA